MSSSGPVIKRLDETVVNRIAAGEVIQRPANAIKEMLENCLDAGSTNITVSVKSGGMKMLQITDNGHGIRKEDMDIVCERFTTSKLRDFSDLQSIATFGFRGEALASISHVAHLTIKTRTVSSQCAYKASYTDGKLKSSPQATAGNTGTQITVEDLFYNVPTRRRALKNANEEFLKISEMMTRYAVHNSGVAFTLKKVGEASNAAGNISARTMTGASIKDNISSLFGANIGKELLQVSEENKSLKFKVNGHVTSPNCRLKKFIFVLFINNRLVDCVSLKRLLDNMYQMYLPNGSHPFVYLSLFIEPQNVDVNVHPTKNEVHFLHESEIIDAVKDVVENKVRSSDSTRTFYTQTLLPSAMNVTQSGSSVKSSKEESKKSTNVYDHQMVRTDSKLQKLDSFLIKSKSSDTNSSSKIKSSTSINMAGDGGNATTSKSALKPKGSSDALENSTFHKRKSEELTFQNDESTITEITKVRQIQLTSVLELQEDVKHSSCKALNDLIKDHTFVGCYNAEFAFIQHSTKLFLCNTTKLSQALFYQILLKDFGNFGLLKFSEPLSLYDLIMIGLENESDSKWCPSDGDKEKLARETVEFLAEKSDMLEDYFSIKIKDGCILGLPMLLLEYEPAMEGLPLLLLRLSTEVDWAEEKGCFETLSREIAMFYSIRKNYIDLDETLSEDTNKENSESAKGWKYTVEHVIYRAFQKYLLPTEAQMTDGTFLQVANLPDLYKVFERC